MPTFLVEYEPSEKSSLRFFQKRKKMVKSQLDTHIYIPFSSKEIQYLLSKFKDDDELTNIVKTDSLIMKVVRALMFRKLLKNEAVNATKQRARTLARLLVQLRLVVK